MRKQRRLAAAAVAVAALLATAGCSSSSASGRSAPRTAAHTGAPIVVGFISSQTGTASSSYRDAQWGAEARIDAQNAAGGVDGRQIKLVEKDDQSVPANNQTAAQLLVQQDNAFGVIDDSEFAFAAAGYLSSHGIPVTGAAEDGPEWNTPPNSNMFSVTTPQFTPVNGKYYAYTYEATVLKALGVTKFAGLTYNLQSAQQSLSSLVQMLNSAGVSTCYDNTSYPLDVSDFTSGALAVKSQGCNGSSFVGLLSNCIALTGALKAVGFTGIQLCPTAYDQSLLSNPAALQTMDGTYTEAFVNFSDPSPALSKMVANLQKYTSYRSGIPNLNIIFGYAAADLMIKGLSLAGPNPTRQRFITNLRNVTGYTAGGLFANAPVNFKGFGTAAVFPKKSCEYFFKITKSGFQPYDSGKPVCGTLVATHS